VNKLKAYALQERGVDTLDANLALGFAGDLRTYDLAAEILTDLGIGSIQLMTNNPEKVNDLKRSGIVVSTRVNHVADINEHNHRYLKTKQDRMGHLLSMPEK
jgi:3,4-dihydroxy 2-butanone 4-phosphate synthase/GTP cyclohydrolase II